MSRYTLTRSAERDIRDVWDYVAAENFETSDTLLDRFYARFLQTNPACAARGWAMMLNRFAVGVPSFGHLC